MERPSKDPVQLDYSSLAEEHRRELDFENERRKRLGDYNEATFGERRPVLYQFLRFTVVVTIGALMIWFLPRRVGYPLALVATAGLAIWARLLR